MFEDEFELIQKDLTEFLLTNSHITEYCTFCMCHFYILQYLDIMYRSWSNINNLEYYRQVTNFVNHVSKIITILGSTTTFTRLSIFNLTSYFTSCFSWIFTNFYRHWINNKSILKLIKVRGQKSSNFLNLFKWGTFPSIIHRKFN